MELYVIKLINDWLKKRNNKKEWWLFLMINYHRVEKYKITFLEN